MAISAAQTHRNVEYEDILKRGVPDQAKLAWRRKPYPVKTFGEVLEEETEKLDHPTD